MTPEEQKEKCLKCEHHDTHMSFLGFNLLRCMHSPYKGELCLEIEKCPKENKPKAI